LLLVFNIRRFVFELERSDKKGIKRTSLNDSPAHMR